MAKFIRNSLIGLGLSAATYMLINQKTPKALYTDIKSYVQEVFDDIQTELDKFQFKIEPHVAIMKKRADHLQDTLDHLTKTTD